MNYTIVPAQGNEIKPQPFQSLEDQAHTKHDLKKVADKGFTPTFELNKVIEKDQTFQEVLGELGKAIQNGHTGKARNLWEVGPTYLNMAKPESGISLDYKETLKARNNAMRIPDELNHIGRHRTIEPPRPGKNKM